MTQEQEKIELLTAELNRLRSSDRERHIRELEALAEARLVELKARSARIAELESRASDAERVNVENIVNRVNAHDSLAVTGLRDECEELYARIADLQAQLAAKPDVASERTYGGAKLPLDTVERSDDYLSNVRWGGDVVHDLATHLRETLTERAEVIEALDLRKDVGVELVSTCAQLRRDLHAAVETIAEMHREGQLASRAPVDVARWRTYGSYSLDHVQNSVPYGQLGHSTIVDLRDHLREALAENAELRAKVAGKREPKAGDRVRCKRTGEEGAIVGRPDDDRWTVDWGYGETHWSIESDLEILPATTSGESSLKAILDDARNRATVGAPWPTGVKTSGESGAT